MRCASFSQIWYTSAIDDADDESHDGFDQTTKAETEYMEDNIQESDWPTLAVGGEGIATALEHPVTAHVMGNILSKPLTGLIAPTHTQEVAARAKALREELAIISQQAIGELRAQRATLEAQYKRNLEKLEAEYKNEQERIGIELLGLGVDDTPAWVKPAVKKVAVKKAAIKAAPKAATKTTKPRSTSSKTHCPVCDIDGHDARKHVGQRRRGEKVKKFTAAELTALGLS